MQLRKDESHYPLFVLNDDRVTTVDTLPVAASKPTSLLQGSDLFDSIRYGRYRIERCVGGR